MNKGLILYGWPGVGKGELGRELARLSGFTHCVLSDIMRLFVSANPGRNVSRVVAEAMENHRLVPDEQTITVFQWWLCQPFCPTEAILDGFCRTIRQKDDMAPSFKAYHFEIAVLYVEANPELAFHRAMHIRKRVGETAEKINKRIKDHGAHTEPAMLAFKRDLPANRFFTVDGHIDGAHEKALIAFRQMQESGFIKRPVLHSHHEAQKSAQQHVLA